ncbi:uncharacterized protein LOC119600545 [Lucilia sericata]|uniref:uncharacterized protein LOC119600545 n=1 Tax=Lucilia sericata TaxID=13632 RepID=UPI0018A83CCD|nr:uncharacterized protein LOC119600545 [Lucilia sericata]
MGITETPQMAVSVCNNSSKLTLALFSEIFKCIEPEVQIDSFEEEQGSGRGDNYTATLYRIHLTGQRKCMDDGKKQKWEKNLICKRLPENVQLREAYKSDKLFRNEVEFYTAIMPELLKFQATKTDEVFKAIPKCFYARPDLLIMEDLRIRGFEMPDRKQGLTVDETHMVLKQVAQFHALSLSYKFENPKEMEKLRKTTEEALFSNDNASWYKNYYETLTKNAIKMVSDVLPEDSKYLQLFKEFAETSTFFSRMVRLVSEESALTAFCHGDCWANNFLYRYEKMPNGEKKVLEVCLVDFQLIRYSSIALDVANLLFCCTSKSMRDAHLEDFIKLYTMELFRWLETLCNRIPDFCNSVEKLEQIFRQELKTYGRFALGLSLDIIPISTCSSEDAPDMYDHHYDDSTLKCEYGAPELNFPPNDLCRQKMSEIVIDMVDNGML